MVQPGAHSTAKACPVAGNPQHTSLLAMMLFYFFAGLLPKSHGSPDGKKINQELH